MRQLQVLAGADLADILRRFLAARQTDSAKALAAKAMVLIYPEDRAGEIMWPLTT